MSNVHDASVWCNAKHNGTADGHGIVGGAKIGHKDNSLRPVRVGAAVALVAGCEPGLQPVKARRARIKKPYESIVERRMRTTSLQ